MHGLIGKNHPDLVIVPTPSQRGEGNESYNGVTDIQSATKATSMEIDTVNFVHLEGGPSSGDKIPLQKSGMAIGSGSAKLVAID